MSPPGARPRPSHPKRQPAALLGLRRKRRLKSAAAAVALTVVAGLGLAYMFSAPADDPGMSMPAFAHRTAEIEAAYEYAASDEGAALEWIPCYCGCGPHSGHLNNRDCFVRPDGTGFDEHGSNCGVCVDIALRVQRALGEGKSLTQARALVDARYAGYPATDTPMPP